MGIPHLTTSLQSFAQHRALQNEAIVIDGPALAYHILHVCRVNGASQPSYRLIAQSTLRWLDELLHHQVAIEAIYFDGHLPSAKRVVRMERLMKSSAQLTRLFSCNPQGCPMNQVAVDDRNQLADVFSSGVSGFKPFIDPGFFVPVVIDCLRQHSRYQTLTSVVPGEADAYCAAHVSKRGGLVLTSDSDLLVYNLGEGKVAFFRDIFMNSDLQIMGSVFAPSQICEKLNLPSSSGLLRLAYERRKTSHSTLSEVVHACSRAIANKSEFRKFHEQYQLPDMTLPIPNLSDQGSFSRLAALDPRISELVVQLSSCPPTPRNDSEDTAGMYLPILIENPNRGSAWEHSRPLRQLAYTLLQLGIPGPGMTVLEYRRVQNVSQRGRRVETMSLAEAEQLIEEILVILKQMKDIAPKYSISHWHLACMAVDASECQKLDKQSLTWSMFQRQHKPSIFEASRIEWDIVHFSAHLQATLYSFRILSQLLSVVLESATELVLPPTARQLRSELLQLPPLARFPDNDDAMRLLSLPDKDALVREFGEALHLTRVSAPEPESEGNPFLTE
ncbi:hypothetical protein XA68_12786 [Ophiocordyceps unilateralis]|uniref:Asteroid domain-containing protein n=1 Tax=Ophiocordyceps unilateralis TaxID=268505 RepID=A0A2A9PE18_OPHUN|nr:hypothetical protein XA68_12786 [Ophiocordyceps unilateralis]